MLGHLQPLVAGLLAALLAWAGAPLAARSARRTGFVDRPTTPLKRHAEPTPYLGGLAVFVPFLAAAALVFELDAAFLGILLAATLAALLGLMDDFGAMRPGVKMIGQLVIILVLLRAGVRIDLEALPLWLNLALTAFWLLALKNALNFLDIMDGLAATVSLVAAASFVAAALLTGDHQMASIGAVLLGALAGYLPHSWPKARLFLGDSGSLFLGVVLGSLALALDYSRVSAWALATPLLILAVPCYEIVFTVTCRVLRRRPPWLGSPDHVALRLRRLGLSVSQVLAVAAVGGLLGGALGTWVLVRGSGAGPAALGLAVLVAGALALVLARAPRSPAA
jgi:UDP-GlcNAc:undecaprenyl-phosphate GlcNAc-1-phosphate transferase